MDLQRKFQPEQHSKLSLERAWKEAFLYSLPEDIAESIDGGQEQRQSIIMVASLLDRVPNLAGLTRTCEVFKAEALVVADLSVVKDPDFKGISVTAERHIDMRVHIPLKKQLCDSHLWVLGTEAKYSGLCNKRLSYI